MQNSLKFGETNAKVLMMSIDNDKPIKPSDSIIDYPDVAKATVSEIKDYLSLWANGKDYYAIKWYVRYLEDEHTFYSDRGNFVILHKIEIVLSYIRNHLRDFI